MNILRGVSGLLRKGFSFSDEGEAAGVSKSASGGVPSWPEVQFSESEEEEQLAALWEKYRAAFGQDAKHALNTFLTCFIHAFEGWKPAERGQNAWAGSINPPEEPLQALGAALVGCSVGHPTEIIACLVQELKATVRVMQEEAQAPEVSNTFRMEVELNLLHALTIVTRSAHNRRIFRFFHGFEALMLFMKGAVVRLKVVAGILAARGGGGSAPPATISTHTHLSFLQCSLAHVMSVVANFVHAHARSLRHHHLHHSGSHSGAAADEYDGLARGSLFGRGSLGDLTGHAEGVDQVHPRAEGSTAAAAAGVEPVPLLETGGLGTMLGAGDAALQHMTLQVLRAALAGNPRLQNPLRSLDGLEVLLALLAPPGGEQGAATTTVAAAAAAAGGGGGGPAGGGEDEFATMLLALQALREAVFRNVGAVQHLEDVRGFDTLALLLQWAALTFSRSPEAAAAAAGRLSSSGEAATWRHVQSHELAPLLTWNPPLAEVCKVLCSFNAVPPSEVPAGRLRVTAGRDSDGGGYWERVTGHVVCMFLDVFRKHRHSGTVTPAQAFFRRAPPVLQRFVVHYLKRVLALSPAALQLLRSHNVWDVLFAHPFFPYGVPFPVAAVPVPILGSISGPTSGSSSGPVSGANLDPVTAAADTLEAEELRMEILTCVELAATQADVGSNLPECSALVEHLQEYALRPAVAVMLASSLQHLLQLATPSTLPSLLHLEAAAVLSSVMRRQQLAFAHAAGATDPPLPLPVPLEKVKLFGKGGGGVADARGREEWWRARAAVFGLFGEYVALSPEACAAAARSADVVATLAGLVGEQRARAFAIQSLVRFITVSTLVPGSAFIFAAPWCRRACHMSINRRPLWPGSTSATQQVFVGAVGRVKDFAEKPVLRKGLGALVSSHAPDGGVRSIGTGTSPNTNIGPRCSSVVSFGSSSCSIAMRAWRAETRSEEDIAAKATVVSKYMEVLSLAEAAAPSSSSSSSSTSASASFSPSSSSSAATTSGGTGTGTGASLGLLTDLLGGIRDVLDFDPQVYQGLLVRAGCYVHLINTLSATSWRSGDDAMRCQLALDVLLTITRLAAGNESSKAELRSLVGPGHSMLGSVLLETHAQRPSRALLLALLNMLVDGDFAVPSEALIQHKDVVVLFFTVLQKCTRLLQLEGLETFEQLLSVSTANCAACADTGLLALLLSWLPRGPHDAVLHAKLTTLLQLVGGHSIGDRDLKALFALMRGGVGAGGGGRRPRLAGTLVRALRHMAGAGGPAVFFELDGKQSGIELSLPITFPTARGYSFCCWMRAESLPPAAPNDAGAGEQGVHEYAHALGLFSLFTDFGKGCSAFLLPRHLILYAASSKDVITAVEFPFRAKCWHHVAVSHQAGRMRGGSTLRVFIDGRPAYAAKTSYPKIYDPLTTCTFMARARLPPGEDSTGAGGDELAEEPRLSSPFRGQCGPLYLFDDAITAPQAEAIHALGPEYMYSFSPAEVPGVAQAEPATAPSIFDGKDGLAPKIVVSFNAQATDGKLVFNTAPRVEASGGASSSSSSTSDACILPGVTLCRRHRLQDTIHSVGGVTVLFPLLTQLDLSEEEDDDSTGIASFSSRANSTTTHDVVAPQTTGSQLALDVLALLESVLAGHLSNQQDMLSTSGLPVLGLLLQCVSARHLSAEFVHGLQSLAELRSLVGPGHSMLGSVLLETHAQRPSRALLLALLNMLVDGDFAVPSEALIQHKDVVVLFFTVLQKCTRLLQLEGLETFEQLLSVSTANCAACADTGLLALLLSWLPRGPHDAVLHAKLTTLLQLVGGHSIGDRDLKALFALMRGGVGAGGGGRRPRLAGTLVRALRHMAGAGGPAVFFELDGKQSGIELSLPITFPTARGYSFCCWMRAESLPPAAPNDAGAGEQGVHEYAHALGLFSLFTDFGKGCSAFLLPRHLILYAASSKDVITAVEFPFRAKCWHHVAVSHQAGRMRGGSTLRVFIDGRPAYAAKTSYPKIYDPLTTCTFMARARLPPGEDSTGAGGDELAEEPRLSSPFRGQCGPLYLFDDAITAPQAEAIHALGPEYMYSFSPAEVPGVAQAEPATAPSIFDGKDGLAPKIVVSFNAQATDGKLVFNTAPRVEASGGASSSSSSTSDACILPGVTLCRRHRLQDTIHSVGGVTVLFPLLTQLDLSEEEDDDSTGIASFSSRANSTTTHDVVAPQTTGSQLALDVLALLESVLAGHLSNQQDMLSTSGLPVLGLLLQYALLAETLAAEALSELYVAPAVWIRTPYAAQHAVYSSLLRHIDRGAAPLRLFCPFASVFDAMRRYYWDKPLDPDSCGAPAPRQLAPPQAGSRVPAVVGGGRPDAADVANLRGLLLTVADRALGNRPSADDVRLLVAYCELCRDARCLEDVLRFLLDLCRRRSFSAIFGQQLAALGGCHVFLGLLSRQQESIRVLALRLLGTLLLLPQIHAHKKAPFRKLPAAAASFASAASSGSGSGSSASGGSGSRHLALVVAAMESRLAAFPLSAAVRGALFDVLLGRLGPAKEQLSGQLHSWLSEPPHANGGAGRGGGGNGGGGGQGELEGKDEEGQGQGQGEDMLALPQVLPLIAHSLTLSADNSACRAALGALLALLESPYNRNLCIQAAAARAGVVAEDILADLLRAVLRQCPSRAAVAKQQGTAAEDSSSLLSGGYVDLGGAKCPRVVFRLVLLYLQEAELAALMQCTQRFLHLLPDLVADNNDVTRTRLQLFLWTLLDARARVGPMDTGARFHVASQLIRDTVAHARGLLAASVPLPDAAPPGADEPTSVQSLLQQDRVMAASLIKAIFSPLLRPHSSEEPQAACLAPGDPPPPLAHTGDEFNLAGMRAQVKEDAEYVQTTGRLRADEVAALETEMAEVAGVEYIQLAALEEQRRAVLADLCAAERARRAAARVALDAKQQSTIVRWCHTLRDITNERGPWGGGGGGGEGGGDGTERVVHWKLDRSEDPLRRRHRLRPNYRFDNRLTSPDAPPVAAAPGGAGDRAEGKGAGAAEQQQQQQQQGGLSFEGSVRSFLFKGLHSFSGADDADDNDPATAIALPGGADGGASREPAAENDAQEGGEEGGAEVAQGGDSVAEAGGLSGVDEWRHVEVLGGAGGTAGTADLGSQQRVVLSSAAVLVTAKRKLIGRLDLTASHLLFHGERVIEGTGGSSVFSGGSRADVMMAPPPKDVDLNKDVKQHRQWPLHQLKAVHETRYLLQFTSLELFFASSAATPPAFFNFPSVHDAKHFASKLHVTATAAAAAAGRLGGAGAGARERVQLVDKRRAIELAERARGRWQRREVSNFEYLMALNTLAGRSYNDLMQYPVFPWVLADYASPALDLADPAAFRDLSKPVGALDAKRLKTFEERYENFCDPDIPSFHYGSHYSSAGSVLFFLIRLEPFSALNRHLQASAPPVSAFANCLTNTSDVKELVPEFFYHAPFLENANGYYLGAKQDGHLLGDVLLPPWAHGSPEEFVRINREALESEHATNVFYHLTYEGAVDLEALDDPFERASVEDQIANFGQTPMQLFRKKHPKRGPPVPVARPLLYAPASITLTSKLSPSSLYYGPHGSRARAGVGGGEASSSSSGSSPLAVIYVGLLENRVLTVTGNQVATLGSWITPYSQAGSSFTFSSSQDPYFGFGDALYSRRLGAPLGTGGVEGPNGGCFGVLQWPGGGAEVLLTCAHRDNSFRCFAAVDAACVCVVRHHHDAVTCLSVAEDGSSVATGSRDTTVMLWAMDAAASSTTTASSSSSSGGGRGGDAQHRHVRAAFDKPRAVLRGHSDAVLCVAVKSDLDVVVSGSQDATCIVHTLHAGRYLRTLRHPGGGAVHRLAVTKHALVVLYSHSDVMLHTLTLGGRRLASAEANGRLSSVCVSHCGEFVVTGGDTGQVVVRWAHSLEVVRRYDGVGVPVTSMAVTPEDCFIVGLRDGTILVYSIEAQQLKRSVAHFSLSSPSKG
eukprot:jgi/Mesen1/7043/ME000369S06370